MTRFLTAAVILACCVFLALAVRRDVAARTRCETGCVARGFELGLRVEGRCICGVDAAALGDATDHAAPTNERLLSRGGR